MPATTSKASFVDCKVEYASGSAGGTWVDISGIANKVEVTGGEVEVGNDYTFTNRYPLLTAGGRAPITVKVDGLWESVQASGSYAGLRTLADTDPPVARVRYSPIGNLTSGSTGTALYTGDPGYLTALDWPGGDAKSGDPVVIGVTFITPKLTVTALA